MPGNLFTIQQLRQMLGARLRYRGRRYTVIEVLDDQFELVLEADLPTSHIQTDVHGNARREIRELLTVSALNADRSELHPEFLEIAFTIAQDFISAHKRN